MFLIKYYMKIIDMQYDFIPNGEKPIPNIKQQIDKLNDFVKSLDNIKGMD